MHPVDPLTDVDNGGLPPRSFWEVTEAAEQLKEPARTCLFSLIAQMDEDFWDFQEGSKSSSSF